MTGPRCERCGCPATHNLTGPDGFRFVACCRHADQFMRQAAVTVPADEGRTGWQRWKAQHAEMTCKEET